MHVTQTIPPNVAAVAPIARAAFPEPGKSFKMLVGYAIHLDDKQSLPILKRPAVEGQRMSSEGTMKEHPVTETDDIINAMTPRLIARIL